MNLQRGREVITLYRSHLSLIPKRDGPFNRQPLPQEASSHVHGMLDRMEELLNETEKHLALEMGADWDKFNRWLGFVQGVFWLNGDYTLDTMRDHNRTQKT